MKKILIIGMTEGVGGVETFICNIKKQMPNDLQIDFLVHQDINEKYLSEITTNNSQIFKVTGIKDNIFKFLKDIFKFYKLHKYDVVHINECSANMFLYALPLLFDKKPKLIIQSHSTNSKNIYAHKILKFFQNKRANIKWACSDTAFEYMFGKTEEKVIIHNGIDLDKYYYDDNIRYNKRKELGLNSETIFCSIARFSKEKNHEKIVSIFYEYNKINPNSKLVLVGIGPLQKQIIQKVKDMNIDNKVLFLNSRSDVNELLSAFDVLLLPSIFEGLPFIALESQACSLPIFASYNVSREIAITDLVHFIDLNDNSTKWAKKIDEFLASQINRNNHLYHDQISQAGFDIKKVVKFIINNYRE